MYTKYQQNLNTRFEEKLIQMRRIHNHLVQLYNEEKTLDEATIWINIFDDLEAEAQVLVLLKECYEC